MRLPRLGDSSRHWGVTDERSSKGKDCSLCGHHSTSMFYFDDNEGYAYEYVCRRCLQMAVHEIDKLEVF